jgi:hypothetical protein
MASSLRRKHFNGKPLMVLYRITHTSLILGGQRYGKTTAKHSLDCGFSGKAVSALNCTFANCYETKATPYFILAHFSLRGKPAGSCIYCYF